MNYHVGQQVVVADDIYEDGIEQIASLGEVGQIRAFREDGLVYVEFEIGRVCVLHPSCFTATS
ncbi:hypothetical protein NZD89_06795 [Alicyclobacillus fastidiosus]|uniref:DUF4926 domain-containing protein n=1 Tax=Alicyclobacillus fastidiosus TaxID=392011 RepID=A0ABY6ZJK2_9BACL|nr:hypothetical protein [Alicyclobacillus fastidiosus]WAH43108.1 hypothetical protein NZD89_06795 [Alicyclobacillus fastidiosus]GMA65109.1 hypothetical protein GCM10025859_55490 [Alicyclobacillus fastidiosus]